MINIDKHTILLSEPVTSALQQLNLLGEDLTLFVLDESQKLVGVVTDGDIRRALIKGVQLSDPVSRLMFEQFKYLQWGDFSLEKIREFREENVELLPIVDDDFRILRIINISTVYSVLPIDVVIMAGGKGERLRPLTLETPKPMLLVGEKTILERNIEYISKFGVTNFFISVRYLREKIESYFGDGSNRDLNISYIREDIPLGTIGSVKLVESYPNDVVLIVNSDILTNINYEDMYRTYLETRADLLIASIGYSVSVPYAILDTKESKVISLSEKPTYTYYANAGIYMVNKMYFDLIPPKQQFDATDLINKMIEEEKNVVCYKLLGYWLDIGKHEDYLKAQEDIKHIKF